MQGSQSNFVVLLQDEKILLVENPAKEIAPGIMKDRGWGLPGGGMKEIDGGSEKKAAKREVEEETGFVIDEERVHCLDYDKNGNHTNWVVTAPIVAGTLRATFGTAPDDVLDARWVPLSAIFDKEIFVYRAHRGRIERAISILEKRPEWRSWHKL